MAWLIICDDAGTRSTLTAVAALLRRAVSAAELGTTKLQTALGAVVGIGSMGVASPTERAADLKHGIIEGTFYDGQPYEDGIEERLPPGSLVVTPEDIGAGYRVLTPEQAETVTRRFASIKRVVSEGVFREHLTWNGIWWGEPIALMCDEMLALLAGVPGKDSDTC